MAKAKKSASGEGGMPPDAATSTAMQATPEECEIIAKGLWTYDRQDPLLPPLVTVKDMSPEFMAAAIKMDFLLHQFRDRFGRAWMVRRYIERRGVTISQLDAMAVPEWVRIDKAGEDARHAVYEMIHAIRRMKPVTAGDRRLKRRSDDLTLENWYSQMGLLHEIISQDRDEGRWP